MGAVDNLWSSIASAPPQQSQTTPADSPRLNGTAHKLIEMSGSSSGAASSSTAQRHPAHDHEEAHDAPSRSAVSSGGPTVSASSPPTVSEQKHVNGSPASPVYLDYNATTPVMPEIAQAALPYLTTHFGNPSSSHPYGQIAKDAIAKARKQLNAALGGEDSGRIIFCGCATESINMAIKGAAFTQRDKGLGDHIVTATTEHVAVLECCRFLESSGFRVTYVPCDSYGRILPDALLAALTPKTILVTVMMANNETGTISPIQELVAAAKRYRPEILFHTDASQALGKMPVDVKSMDVDYLTIAGHKFYAPKGVGALYIKNGTPALTKIVHGASTEFNVRPGTENVFHIVAIGAAAEKLCKTSEYRDHMKKVRDRLQSAILERCKHWCGSDDSKFVRINGHPEQRLPNTLCISFAYVTASSLLHDLRDVLSASPGSACHNDRVAVSHVIKALNVPAEFALGTIRLSTGIFSTEEEVDRCAQRLVDAAWTATKGKLSEPTKTC